MAGIPALISDIPAHREFARDAGDAVWVYRVDDADALAGQLDALLGSDSEILAKARQHAYRLGAERDNWEQEKVILLGLVERALSHLSG